MNEFSTIGNSIMDKTQNSLFDAIETAGDVFTHQATSDPSVLARGRVKDNTLLGKPRNSTRQGQPLKRKYTLDRGHSNSTDKWLDIEPDYKESEVYQWAKEEVLRRVENTSICTYGGLTRHLESERPGTSQYLDSIIDDLKDRISHDKTKPAPSIITMIGIDTKKIDYEKVFA